MRIIQQATVQEQQVTGRLSDGSDRQVVTATVTYVDVMDDAGVLHTALRFDHAPSAQEIVDLIGQAVDVVPTSKAALNAYIALPYQRWQMWKNIHAEAITRSLAANVLTALTNQENAAWTDLATAVNNWRTAV